jgi:hypothetical protein
MSTRSELHILLEAADQEDSPFMRQAQRRRAFFSAVLASGDTEALEMLMEESDSDWSTSDCSDCEDDDAKEEFKEELPRKKRTYFKRCVICPFCFVRFVVISFRLSLSEGIERQARGGSIAILLTEAIGGTPLIDGKLFRRRFRVPDPFFRSMVERHRAAKDFGDRHYSRDCCGRAPIPLELKILACLRILVSVRANICTFLRVKHS